MARPPKNIAAAADLGKRLSTLRAAYERKHGSVSFDRVARRIEFAFGVPMTGEQARKFHRGEVDPNTAQIDEMAALAIFYGVPVAKLGKTAESRIDRIVAF